MVSSLQDFLVTKTLNDDINVSMNKKNILKILSYTWYWNLKEVEKRVVFISEVNTTIEIIGAYFCLDG